jgi:1,4-alpha-glucan branching enzyme
VIYELHVGTFTPEGTYAGVIHKLNHLKETGITAIELMPLSDFAGRRNWGYDGVLPYAPDGAYGRPEELKALVQAAHDAGLMVFLDVVYNHFGPKGNYLHVYAPQFFTERHKTPWGAAIDFGNEFVRSFFVHNARYWLEEFRFDGLRFDAVHAIHDDSPEARACRNFGNSKEDFRDTKHWCWRTTPTRRASSARASTTRSGTTIRTTATTCWRPRGRRLLRRVRRRAGEASRALPRRGLRLPGRGLAFTDERRGEPSAHCRRAASSTFLQNHDQIGNRAMGERLIALTEDAS